MLRECLTANPAGTYTVWVTTFDLPQPFLSTLTGEIGGRCRDERLRAQVAELCGSVGNANFAFVSCPSVLLGAMAQATIREIAIESANASAVNLL